MNFHKLDILVMETRMEFPFCGCLYVFRYVTSCYHVYINESFHKNVCLTSQKSTK